MSSPDTMPCRGCGNNVPAGKFCGLCGARLTHGTADRPGWLRLGDHAAAPGESVLQPSIVSSLFPHLPEGSHRTFRVGLLMIAVALLALALLGWQVPLISVAILAPLLIFAIYLIDAGVAADLPRWVWLLTVVVGLGVGIGWAQMTASLFAQSYGSALDTPVPDVWEILGGLIIPFGGVLVMQVPALVVWLARPRQAAEALDGYAVGAMGAQLFAVAATTTRLIPELRSGVLTEAQPILDLVIAAGVLGVTMPLTAAAFGGSVGTGLWFAANLHGRRRARLLVTVAAILLGAAGVYAASNLLDLFDLPVPFLFGLHVAVAVVSLIGLRIVQQVALLRERDHIDPDVHPELPILCPDCGHVIPDMTFCPACGVAAHASSRTSREARRRVRPEPSAHADS